MKGLFELVLFVHFAHLIDHYFLYLENKKIKAKFKYADRLAIPYVIVIGEDEIANNTVTLKNMQTGEQETLKIEEVIKKIK